MAGLLSHTGLVIAPKVTTGSAFTVIGVEDEVMKQL